MPPKKNWLRADCSGRQGQGSDQAARDGDAWPISRLASSLGSSMTMPPTWAMASTISTPELLETREEENKLEQSRLL